MSNEELELELDIFYDASESWDDDTDSVSDVFGSIGGTSGSERQPLQHPLSPGDHLETLASRPSTSQNALSARTASLFNTTSLVVIAKIVVPILSFFVAAITLGVQIWQARMQPAQNISRDQNKSRSIIPDRLFKRDGAQLPPQNVFGDPFSVCLVPFQIMPFELEKPAVEAFRMV